MVSREDFYRVTEYHGEVWIRIKVVFDSSKDITQAIQDLYTYTTSGVEIESLAVDTKFTHNGLHRWTAVMTTSDWMRVYDIEDCLEEAQNLLDSVLIQDNILEYKLMDYECNDIESESYWTD